MKSFNTTVITIAAICYASVASATFQKPSIEIHNFSSFSATYKLGDNSKREYEDTFAGLYFQEPRPYELYSYSGTEFTVTFNYRDDNKIGIYLPESNLQVPVKTKNRQLLGSNFEYIVDNNFINTGKAKYYSSDQIDPNANIADLADYPNNINHNDTICGLDELCLITFNFSDINFEQIFNNHITFQNLLANDQTYQFLTELYENHQLNLSIAKSLKNIEDTYLASLPAITVENLFKERDSNLILYAEHKGYHLGGLRTEEFYASEIPLPAGVWLFGSALIGLMGFTKRK